MTLLLLLRVVRVTAACVAQIQAHSPLSGPRARQTGRVEASAIIYRPMEQIIWRKLYALFPLLLGWLRFLLLLFLPRPLLLCRQSAPPALVLSLYKCLTVFCARIRVVQLIYYHPLQQYREQFS